MPYLSSIERNALKKGEEKGLLRGIELAMDAKFGRQGGKLMGKVRTLGGLAELDQFARFLKMAKTLDEVREYLG